MTRMEGIRQAARVLSLTRPDTAAELEAAQILKSKLLRCVLSPTDLQEHRVALLALIGDATDALAADIQKNGSAE